MPLPLVVPLLAQRLKTETAQHHRETEDVMIPVLQNLQSQEGYIAVLKTMYGFHAPLESLISQHIPASVLPDVDDRNRSVMARHDLAILGSNGEPATCAAFPVINNTAKAFGALYVLEGSALGGKYIASMLSKNTALDLPAGALQFFQGYGKDTGSKWTTFLAALSTQEAAADEVVEAANQTFLSFKKWMQETFQYEFAR